MAGRALGRGRLIRQQRGRSPVYVGDWRNAVGKRVRRVLSTDRRVSERMLAEIIRERDLELAGLAEEERQDVAVAALQDRYLEELGTRVSEGHHKNTRRRLEKIIGELSVARLADLRPAVIHEWRSRRLEEGVANRTVNLDVSSLQSMLRWALDAELIGVNPVARVKPLPEGKRNQRYRRRAMTEEEIECFLAAARADDAEEAKRVAAERTLSGGTKGRPYSDRERRIRIPQTLLWLGFLETGARWSALTRVVWADIDQAHSTLRLRVENAKAEKEQCIPLRRGFLDQIEHLRQLHREVLGRGSRAHDRVFLTPRGEAWPSATRNAMRILDRILDAAGIAKVDETGRKLDIHALRHTFGTRLLRAGAGLYQVQKLMGHSDPKLTADTYSHLVVDDLRDVVDLLPGGGPRRAIHGTKVAHDPEAPDGDEPKPLREMERPMRFELTTFSLGS